MPLTRSAPQALSVRSAVAAAQRTASGTAIRLAHRDEPRGTIPRRYPPAPFWKRPLKARKHRRRLKLPPLRNHNGMERISSKHGPRQDDELAREVESLVRGAPVEARNEEFREKEGAADGEREPSARTVPPGELGPDATAARTELSRFLRLSVF